MEGKTMKPKREQGAPKRNGRPNLRGARNGRGRFAVDVRSIISAAHLLPAEVTPPKRVWRSLRAQLEKEGILGNCSVLGKLEENTRFPAFNNYTVARN